MNNNIPELLLLIPTVSVDEQYVQGGHLTLSIEDAIKKAEIYYKEVETFLQNAKPQFHLEKDIIPAIDFGLRLFNAENFSGELVPEEREQFSCVLNRFTMISELHERYMQRLLLSDGELPHPCVRLSGLLISILAIVQSNNNIQTPMVPYHSIWRLRTHMRHQLILQHRAHSIFTKVSSCVKAILALSEDEITPEHLVEIGHMYNYFHNREIAAETFWRAAKKSGLSISEEAMIGVRTRWQQHQVIQMVMNASSSRSFTLHSLTNNNNKEEDYEEDEPRVVMSEKDGHDLLDRPRETPDTPAPQLQPLHPTDKAIILALCVDIRNTNPYHGLTQHHMQTYIERLLADPASSPFMIQCQTLLIRSRLESRRNRVQERAFMQLTELVDQFSAIREPKRKTFHRTDSKFFYTVAYPSIWQLKSEYAEFCYEENLFKTALDAYEQVLDWENIIKCCKALDKRKRAESLARELLETDPYNPMLWVALGEATREVNYLWKAWELSNHLSAAPMRALAKLALEREEYKNVVKYFDEAVKLNPVFGGDWFSLGYAAMRLEEWEISGEAFTRVCQIQPNDAYAWNNLASVLLRNKMLRPAFNAMSQALRNNRRDWRMWQNYFSIGCELKEVTETTNALNVVLEIAKRNVRLEKGSLNRFVDNAIAYMEGKIPASARDQDESEVKHLPVSLINDNDNNDIDINMSEKEKLAMSELIPFGSDVEMPDDFFTQNKSSKQSETIRAGIIERYKQRMRETFKHITDLFVTDPEIYACAAKLQRYMDGPLSSYDLRIKELRCCQQKDQWERQEEKFARTCESLNSMTDDVIAALEELIKNSNNYNTNKEMEEKQQEEQKKVISALSDILNNTMAVIEATEEYMSETENYKQLRVDLLPKIKSSLQNAKATFILN